MEKVIKPPYWAYINHSHPLARGLAGYWLFNEGTGNIANDLSGQSNHGIITGASWVPGKDGHALYFDGNDYIQAFEDTGFDFGMGNFSVEVTLTWTDSVYSYIFCLIQGNVSAGVRLGVAVAGTGNAIGAAVGEIYLWNGVAITLTGIVLSQDTWYRLTVVRRGTGANQFYIYVDSVEQMQGQWNVNIAVDRINIGAMITTSNFLIGHIGSCAIYRRALSTEEIAWLYREPYAPFWHSKKSRILTIQSMQGKLAYPIEPGLYGEQDAGPMTKGAMTGLTRGGNPYNATARGMFKRVDPKQKPK